ncbi:hypothetical protein JAAARDRAFT_200297 [Jaapia argillacea MUCL 33604]|uniref:Uncharacterized protein n=1 Tax=Jaapia argillacea MUCL 33604 TaxID=933084 RepID=A0A067P573_9AGAM|nr:hypothetical protein JAAARDRAFT_200297 [Jaapia argillacea MUCL 33604]
MSLNLLVGPVERFLLGTSVLPITVIFLPPIQNVVGGPAAPNLTIVKLRVESISIADAISSASMYQAEPPTFRRFFKIHRKWGLFTSPNTNLLPPDDACVIPDHNTEVCHLAHTRIHSNAFPMLPYLFKYPLRRGLIFSRLDYTSSTVPIVYEDGFWRLEGSLRCSWLFLERVLTNLAVMAVAEGDDILKTNFSYPPSPQSVGYLDGHPNAQNARNACADSLHAFDLLIATCSMAIATCSTRSWLMDLASNHPAYFDLLAATPINSFDVSSRVGVVIIPNQCLWVGLVPHLIALNIPVWFYWGTTEDPVVMMNSEFAWLHALAPTGEELRSILAQSPSISSPEPAQVSRHLSRRPLLSGSLRSVRQPPSTWHQATPFEGENFDEYFARRRRFFCHGLEHRGAVLLWLENSLGQGSPARTAANVYEWVLRRGAYVRRRLTRSEGEDRWHQFRDSQRHYDPVEDAWDLCQQLDPEPRDDCLCTEETYREICEHTLELFTSPSTYTFSRPPLLTRPHHLEFIEDITRIPTVRPMEYSVPDIQFESVEELLRLRYGYDCEAKPPKPEIVYSLSDIQKMTSYKVEGVASNGLLDPHHSSLESISAFIQSFHDYSSPPTTQSDLFPNAQNPITLPDDLDIIYVHTPRRFRMTRLMTQSPFIANDLYIIDPSVSAVTWRVAFESPASVLHCIRSRGFSSTQEMAVYCVSKGMAFRTVISLPKDFIPPPPYRGFRFDGLGWRPYNYRPTLVDYRCYETVRDGFLGHEDHARASLMKGGIVWRLSMHVLGNDSVLQGPSGLVTAIGSCHRDTISGASFWDDELTEGEMFMLCGGYHMGGEGMSYLKSAFPPGRH